MILERQLEMADIMTPMHAIVKAGEEDIFPANEQIMMTTTAEDWMQFGYDTPVKEAIFDFIELYNHSPKHIVPGNNGYLLGPVNKNPVKTPVQDGVA